MSHGVPHEILPRRVESFGHLGTGQALCRAEVELGEPRDGVDGQAGSTPDGFGGVTCSDQRGCVDRVEAGECQTLRQLLSLQSAARGQRDVTASRIAMFGMPDGFAVTHQCQLSHGPLLVASRSTLVTRSTNRLHCWKSRTVVSSVRTLS